MKFTDGRKNRIALFLAGILAGVLCRLLTHTFEGGKYAVYHYKGFPQLLFMVYQEIFCRWLSKTGNQLDERPIIDIYRNVREDGYMEIDICFPLK